jgi:AcrR family transcriptional regulator
VNSKKPNTADSQLKALLSRTDWGDILQLLEKKAYQRKFQIIEAFTELVSIKGLHRTTHTDIAKKCGIARQLVDHHFPDETSLVTLTYRYIYAGFQKAAADGLTARSGFVNQLNGYIEAVAAWIASKRTHARFLVQFYALLQLNPEFAAIQERNLRIGQERIVSLCNVARKEGLFQNVSDETLAIKASSLQTYILGFLVMHSWKDLVSVEARQELWRTSLAILDISPKKSQV